MSRIEIAWPVILNEKKKSHLCWRIFFVALVRKNSYMCAPFAREREKERYTHTQKSAILLNNYHCVLFYVYSGF